MKLLLLYCSTWRILSYHWKWMGTLRFHCSIWFGVNPGSTCIWGCGGLEPISDVKGRRKGNTRQVAISLADTFEPTSTKAHLFFQISVPTPCVHTAPNTLLACWPLWTKSTWIHSFYNQIQFYDPESGIKPCQNMLKVLKTPQSLIMSKRFISCVDTSKPTQVSSDLRCSEIWQGRGAVVSMLCSVWNTCKRVFHKR